MPVQGPVIDYVDYWPADGGWGLSWWDGEPISLQGVLTEGWGNQIQTTSRLFLGSHIIRPHSNTIRLRHLTNLASSHLALDAVQYSSVAVISTYVSSYYDSAWRRDPQNMQVHFYNTVLEPVWTTTAGHLAVYDEKLWRSEWASSRIAYLEIREPPTVYDTNQSTITYQGNGGSAKFRDTGQDFSEWASSGGDANYKIEVVNSDSSICWGYLGASENSDQDILVYSEKNLTTRGWLGDVTDPYGTKTPSSYEIRSAVPPEEEVTGWSDWIDLTASARIERMCEFIGRLFVGTDDALWAYESGRTYRVVDFSGQQSASNFLVMKATQGALWFNIGTSLWRYTSGGLLEEMDFLTKSRGVGPPRYPTSIEEGPGCIYITCRDIGRSDKCATLYRLDTETGAAQKMWNFEDLHRGLKRDTGIVFTAQRQEKAGDVKAMFKPTLWYGPMNSTIWDPDNYPTFARFGNTDMVTSEEDFAPDHAPPEYSGDGYLATFHECETVWMDFGYPALKKTWIRVRFMMKNFLASDYVGVYYRIRKQGTLAVPVPPWLYLGTFSPTHVDDNGRVTLEFPAGTVSEFLQLKFGIAINYTTSSGPGTGGDRVRFSSVEVDALFGATGSRRWTFNAIVTDGMELLNGVVENSAAYVAEALYSLSSTGTIHKVAVPYPSPQGHTVNARVELGAVGAVVPILTYTGVASTLPGAEYAVAITEV